MRDLPQNTDPNLLVGSSNADDAGVYKLSENTALVQTLDFFTPIVDDPYTFGQIAASNSLSDVYAMGGRPITAMAIAGMPDSLSIEVIQEIFKGGADKVIESGCSLVGGHTIKNPEPIYGLSVTGIVKPNHFFSNEKMKNGDVLILSKPLGTGVISSAIKQKKCSVELNNKAVTAMVSLNTAGATLAEHGLAHACTDVTGFGLLGHLWEMSKASNISVKLNASTIPAITDEVFTLINNGCIPGGSLKNLENVSPHLEIHSNVSKAHIHLLADAQTAGGLLISCPENQSKAVIKILQEEGSLCSNIIGQCTPSVNSPKIQIFQ